MKDDAIVIFVSLSGDLSLEVDSVQRIKINSLYH